MTDIKGRKAIIDEHEFDDRLTAARPRTPPPEPTVTSTADPAARPRSRLGLLRSPNFAKLWVGDTISQADITLACFITYLREAVPLDLDTVPALAARVARLEAMPLFAASYTPFDPPVPTAPGVDASPAGASP